MSELDKATSARNGISLDNITGLFAFSGDPSVLGFDTPLGCLILADDGKLWQKKTVPTTGWEEIPSGNAAVAAHKNTHVSGGSDAFTSSDFLEAIVARLRESGGPTDLLIGSIADGELLGRSGSGVIGVDPASLAADVDDVEATPTTGASTTSQIYVDLPGATFNTAAGATRHHLVNFTGTASVDKANKSISIRLVIGGVVDLNSDRQIDAPNSNALLTIATTHAGVIPPGTEVKVQWAVIGSNSSVTIGQGTLNALGIG